MYAYNTHYDTLWYTILQYFTLPQNDPPWIDKGIQWPLRRFLHLPQFTNLSKQLMDNNILSQQPQHPQHNNNNTSLKTIMDNNNVFRLQRHHRPCFQWLSRKLRNYIHVSWWNSEAYFKKFAKSTKDQALSDSHTCKKREIVEIYLRNFFWIFRKIGWECEINTAPKPSPEVAPSKMEVAPF